MRVKDLYRQKIVADLHTHTIFSKHAYSTAREVIQAARERHLTYIAITDHFFLPKDYILDKNTISQFAYQDEWFNMRDYADVRVIGGMEMNLCQDIPLCDKDLKKLAMAKWRPIGLHSWFLSLRDMTPAMVYKEFEKAVRSKPYSPLYPTALAHIEREIENLDYKKHYKEYMKNGRLSDDIKEMLMALVDLACDEGIPLELNESSMRYNKCGNVEAIRYWLNYAKEKKAKIYMGTDSHYCEAVGIFERSLDMLEEVKYPIDLILNCDEIELMTEIC